MKKLIILCMLIACHVAIKAQVMWNLKGGIMQNSIYESEYDYDHDYTIKAIDWAAGLEIEIPLSQKLNIETGLRYKNHLAMNGDESEEHWTDEFWEGKHHLEMPLRLAYKQQLGKHFSLHAGVGPYASWSIGNKNGYDFGDNIVVGLEPSVAINWNCLSLGATYNLPCFYEGYKDLNKTGFMVTLGIRFKSGAWKYIGAGLLAVASVGASLAAVWPDGNDYSSASSYTYSGGDSSSSYSTSGSNAETMYYNWEKRARDAYEHLAGQTLSASQITKRKQLLREAQREMKKWRNKAKQHGVNITPSYYETVDVGIR